MKKNFAKLYNKYKDTIIKEILKNKGSQVFNKFK